jgi:hypothetical protein
MTIMTMYVHFSLDSYLTQSNKHGGVVHPPHPLIRRVLHPRKIVILLPLIRRGGSVRRQVVPTSAAHPSTLSSLSLTQTRPRFARPPPPLPGVE